MSGAAVQSTRARRQGATNRDWHHIQREMETGATQGRWSTKNRTGDICYTSVRNARRGEGFEERIKGEDSTTYLTMHWWAPASICCFRTCDMNAIGPLRVCVARRSLNAGCFRGCSMCACKCFSCVGDVLEKEQMKAVATERETIHAKRKKARAGEVVTAMPATLHCIGRVAEIKRPVRKRREQSFLHAPFTATNSKRRRR